MSYYEFDLKIRIATRSRVGRESNTNLTLLKISSGSPLSLWNFSYANYDG